MESIRIVEGRHGRLTPAKYQELALRTYQGKHLPREATLLYHAAKIVEEVHEVYHAPIDERVEELGIRLGDVHLPKSASWGPALDHAVAIASLLAKHIGQGRELDKERLILLVIGMIARLAGLAPVGWQAVMAENVLKLEKRYNIG